MSNYSLALLTGLITMSFLTLGCKGGIKPKNESLSDKSNPSVISDISYSLMLDYYFETKDALVEGDSVKVVQLALATISRITTQNSSELTECIVSLSQSQSLKQQRMLFQVLSGRFYELLKQNSKQEDPIYLQHCPMAFNNEGADWLSQQKQILNPYFGNKMLHCGSIKETL